MARLFLALSGLAMTCGIAAAISPTPEAATDRFVEVVGRERPLFLGSMAITASALADKR